MKGLRGERQACESEIGDDSRLGAHCRPVAGPPREPTIPVCGRVVGFWHLRRNGPVTDDLPAIRLPLRIRTVGEAVAIEDDAGVKLAYVYFEDEPGRREVTRRVTKAEAIALARLMARTLTERASHPSP